MDRVDSGQQRGCLEACSGRGRGGHERNKRLYPGIRTHFISYRVASWSDTDFSSEEVAGFEYDLQQAGIMPLPLEAIIPRYRFALSDYILGPNDYHPNARAHRLIAEFILREIKPDH
jgi:hypothetical protein